MSGGLGIRRLLRPFRLRLAAAVLAGMVGGGATAGMLAAIADLIHQREGASLVHLGLLAALALCGTMVADMAANRIGLAMVAGLRRHLARMVLAAPLAELERFRAYRLLPILTSDIAVLSEMASVLPPLAVSLVVVAGCITYLAALSLPLCALTLLAMAAGIGVQFRVRLDGIRLYGQARDGEDDLQRQFRAIIEGAKELRLHEGRRARLLANGFDAAVERIRALQVRAMMRLILGRTLGSALLVLLITLVLGFAAAGASAPDTAPGFVLVLLFLKGPLDLLMNHLPTAGRAHIALKRLRDAADRLGGGAGEETRLPARPVAFQTLRLDRVTYAPGDGFRLGPVDFVLHAGETVFIVGENGAGKTTLLKLLLGLYSPDTGSITWNGLPVTGASRDAYRQTFAAILVDHFLFDGPAEGAPEQAAHLIHRLGLAGKVSLEGGLWSHIDLSTGQRKRLALVDAWLQDRPVMVFDELAADQDPAFRRIFYTQILPELKREGRTLVVISHDDRFFHHADRIVRLENGRLAGPHGEAGEP